MEAIMLTKERTSKTRKFKYVAVALALLAVLVFCFASCGKATPTEVTYVDGSLAKAVYNQGEFFDCTGAQIKVTYDNGAVETKDVTVDMVGNSPLMLGMDSVSVTYSEDGVTVIGYIPVSVNDPYKAERAEAIDGFYNNANVKANPSDKGLATLIRDYTAKVEAAAGKDEIAAYVTNFAEDVAAFVEAKQAILADLDAVYSKEGGLYDTFEMDVLSLKENAIASIKAAGTIDEAKTYLDSFKVAVENKREEQNRYEGNAQKPGQESGQIYDKIGLLNIISDYKTKTNLLMDIVTTAYANGEITASAYNAKMFGKPATETEPAVPGYEYVLGRLWWWEEYIRLAINLNGLGKTITDEIDKLIETPIDLIADELKKGVTVVPAEYTWDETTKAYIDGEDVIGALLERIANNLQAAKDQFGPTGVETLLEAYGIDNSGNPIIRNVITDIETKYDALNVIRDDVVAKDIIDLIDAALAAEAGDAKADALDKAWQALKDWGTLHDVFSYPTKDADGKDIAIATNNLVYDDKFNGDYSVTLVDDKWNANNPGEWKDYDFTKDYIILYFVPNLDDLITATRDQDAYDVKAEIKAIGDVILSYTDTVADANGRILDAQAALDKFAADHGDDVFAEYFPVVKDNKSQAQLDIDAARAQYTKLETMAEDANEAIVAYDKYLKDEERDVVRSDYESTEGLLAAAYQLYCDFAAENTDSKGKIYTDVIDNAKDDAGVVTATGNEKSLIASMDEYVVLAYAEERHVQSDKIISEAWLAREALIPTDDTNFRTALQNYKQGKIDFISTDATYDYKTAFDKDGDGVIDLEKNNFNYDEILKANLDIVKAVSAEVAVGIEKVEYVNGALKFPAN